MIHRLEVEAEAMAGCVANFAQVVVKG